MITGIKKYLAQLWKKSGSVLSPIDSTANVSMYQSTNTVSVTTPLVTAPGELNLTAGGTNQNVALTPSGTGTVYLNGDITIAPDGIVTPYLVEARTNIIGISNQTSGKQTAIELMTKDGDSTDMVAILLWAKGNYLSTTNVERLFLYFDVANATWRLLSNQGGTGTLHPVAIGTGSNSNQLYLDPISNIGIGQTTFGANATKTLAVSTGVAPTTSPADAFQMYSKDFAAGNACPTFRTEGGTEVVLNQDLKTTASVTFANVTDSALTAGRVVIAGASGLLADDADLTFATDTLTSTKIVVPTEGRFGSTTNKSTFNATGDLSFAGTARINWSKITANSITVTDASTAGSVTDLQAANDGNILSVTEGAPNGGDMIVDFINVTAFNWVRNLFVYDGSSVHALGIELYNWNATAWYQFGCCQTQFTDGGTLMCNKDFFVPDDTNYIGTGGDAGKVRVRFIHRPASGNAAHIWYFDEVALYQ